MTIWSPEELVRQGYSREHAADFSERMNSPRTPAAMPPPPPDPVQPATSGEIRAWCRANGYAVKDKGRLAPAALAAYEAAH